MSDAIKTKANDDLTKIDAFFDALENVHTQKLLVPAVRWAQSTEKIFLEVKFSHRFDTPG